MIRLLPLAGASFAVEAGLLTGAQNGGSGDVARRAAATSSPACTTQPDRPGADHPELLHQRHRRQGHHKRHRQFLRLGPAKLSRGSTPRIARGSSQGSGKTRSYSLSARSAGKPAGTVAVSYGSRDESNEANTEDARGWSLTTRTACPKRTTLYTAFSHINNQGDANYGWNFTPAAGEPSVVMAGIRHRF